MIMNYTIPSDNRELQLFQAVLLVHYIIPYQVITGNYNGTLREYDLRSIIPYQVITGNYNHDIDGKNKERIIPYQVITGNYNG